MTQHVRRDWDGDIAVVPTSVLSNTSLSREARLLYAIACGMTRYPGDPAVAKMLGVRQTSLPKFWAELTSAGMAELVTDVIGGSDVYVLKGTWWDTVPAAPAVAAPAVTRKVVSGKAVSDDERLLAEGILAHFNQVAGTRYTLNNDHLRMLVCRIRNYSSVGLQEHQQIIERFFEGDRWWTGRPGLNLIYGNDAQFERCWEAIHGGTGRGGSLSARDMLRAASSMNSMTAIEDGLPA
jgi:hypothetical protein